MTIRRNNFTIAALAFLAVLHLNSTVRAAGSKPFSASEQAVALDPRIDWSQARLIAVQDGGRYKTLDSFARESMAAMYGAEHLPGLSPTASLMEWLFNRDAYADAPVIYIKDKGVRIHLSAHLPDATRIRIQQSGYMTPRELSDPMVAQRIAEMEPLAPMVTAMRRVRSAETVSGFLDRMLRIVPSADPSADAMWHTIDELAGNLPPELAAQAGRMNVSGSVPAVAGVSSESAVKAMALWAGLWKGWREGDAAKVQSSLDGLTGFLPTLAAEGVYPDAAQRSAEAVYYAWGKFTWGYWLYMVGLILGIVAVASRWRGVWIASLALLIAAMGVHAIGIGLRWFILGRIPVANMFEALVGSAWVGIAVALLIELRYRTRVALVGAHAAGFLGLLLAGHVVPGGGTLTTIMGILDDIMLRIHTVLIISSYALIFVAAVIAVIYLFGYYYHRAAGRSAEFACVFAAFGAALLVCHRFAFDDLAGMAGTTGGAKATIAFSAATVAALALLALVARAGVSTRLIASLSALASSCLVLAIGDPGFAHGMAWTMIAGGTLWAAGNWAGMFREQRASVLAAAMSPSGAISLSDRPIRSGALPAGGATARDLPAWLQHADRSHVIILNMVFIMLFVGTILGAVWADYSWGRPWGWDPKEVFALNTWIIYAILIHMRFVSRNKGLTTAWLSVIGCLMMAFNWCFVNFYIVGLHSYA